MERTTHFTHDALSFPVLDEGPLDGPPVVLLHGFPEDASSWDRVVPLLHDAGLRTLRFDQRGYAPTARPPRIRDYGMADLVGDLMALADSAGLDDFHLVGHDWGGGVAWQAAHAHPGRVRTLTSVSIPHPRALARAARGLDQARRSWYVAAFQVPWLPERWLARRLVTTLVRTGLPAQHAERYARRHHSPADLTGPVNWYRAIAPWQVRAAGLRPAGAVSVPTTLVWGNRDVALGRRAAEGSVDFVEADYRFVELDAGHWLPECNPEDVAGAVIARVRS